MTRMRPGSRNDRNAVSPEAVRAALSAIHASGVLGQGVRRGRLLEYLVERELAGEGETLKAYAIALDVFDRKADFDPNTDSIVRTEVGRLRDALSLYRSGQADPALPVIEIPKGTYRPRFLSPTEGASGRSARWRNRVVGALACLALGGGGVMVGWTALDHRAQEAVIAEAALPWSDLPYRVLRVAVHPLEAKGTQQDVAKLAFGLHSEIVTDLSAYPWIAVVDTPDDAAQADYALNGQLLWQNDDVLMVHAQLVALPERRVVWVHSERLSASASAIQEGERTVASQIVRRLAAANGIAPDLVKALNARYSETSLNDLLCVLGVYPYLVAPDATAHAGLRTCLTEVVQAYPRYGVAWAALAMIHMDEGRFGINARPGTDPWAEAEHAVGKALKYAPLRMPTLDAALLLSVEAPERDLDAFEHYAARLLDLYPRHPGTLALIGSRMAAVEGHWDTGLALIDRALALDPDPPDGFFVVPALHAVTQGAPDAARTITARLTRSNAPIDLLLSYLAAARAGDVSDAVACRQRLAATGLSAPSDMERFIRARRYHPDLEAALLTRLDEALTLEQAERG